MGIIETPLPEGDGLHILYCYTKGAYDEQPIEWITRRFVFTTDDTKPAISLNSPINGSTHQSGTIVSLNITDINGIGEVYYSWNGGGNVSLVAPFNISLPSDIGTYMLRVYATDVAGNSASETYMFAVTELSGAFILTDLLVYGIILATLVSLIVILRKKRV